MTDPLQSHDMPRAAEAQAPRRQPGPALLLDREREEKER